MSRKRRDIVSSGPPSRLENTLVTGVLLYALVTLFAALVFVWYLVTAFNSPKSSYSGTGQI